MKRNERRRLNKTKLWGSSSKLRDQYVLPRAEGTLDNPQKISRWVVKAKYAQAIVAVDLVQKAKRWGGLASTCCMSGAF